MTQFDKLLKDAVDAVDRQFGRDYAKRNPRVLTALLRTDAADINSETTKWRIDAIANLD